MVDKPCYSIATVYTVNKLSLPPYNRKMQHNVALTKCNTISTLNYLQDVPLHTYDDPLLLIGIAVVGLIKSLDTRSVHPGESIAVLFTLGY